MISIVVPTFNESKNIPLLVERIAKAMKKERYEVIIVDDNSPDGTYKTAVSLSKKYPVKAILRKTEKGLSSAAIRGFSEARGEIIGVMDADLQHPPEKLPEMMAEIRKGADICVGSRWIKGGSAEGWSWKRRVISKGAKLLAFPLTGVKDNMSGMFFFKREVLTGVKLNPIGFKILLEILVKGNYKKAREVPIRFATRSYGESKLKSKVIFQYLKHLGELYNYWIFKRRR